MPIKIVIIGPESTGKSTLTIGLAKHFKEPWVKEYAREFIEQLGRPYEYEDLLAIAKGQIVEEKKIEKHAKKFMFCDTDLHVIKIWSQHKYGKVHQWTLDQLDQREYDLYLLTDIDVPWEEDIQREHPDKEMRKHLMYLYHDHITKKGKPYYTLSGNKETRLIKAIEVINAFSKNKP